MSEYTNKEDVVFYPNGNFLVQCFDEKEAETLVWFLNELPDFEEIKEIDREHERRQFAAMAMQAFVTRSSWDDEENCARISVKYADALIKELNK